MLKKILGALKTTIDSHGDITLENYGSAAKRIYGELVKKNSELLCLTEIKLLKVVLSDHDDKKVSAKGVVRVFDMVLNKKNPTKSYFEWVNDFLNLK